MTAIPSMNMASAFAGLMQPVALYCVIRIENPEGTPIPIFEKQDIMAVVQPADDEIRFSDRVDTSKQYIAVDSPTHIKMGDELGYSGKRFKAWKVGSFEDYGYSECIFEELK